MHAIHGRRVLLGWLALLALLVVAGPAARAQDDCAEIVIDGANVFGGGLGDVRAAADELIAAGADVRVRTIGSYAPAASLDAYAEQLEQRCSAWLGPDGNKRPDLVVLLLALEERRTGIYYGSEWTRALGSSAQEIQDQQMAPRFREGDFAGGFVAALDTLRAIDGGAAQPTGGGTAVDGSAGNGWVGVGVCGGALGGITALIAGGFGLRRRRKELELRRAAQQRAREAQRAVVAHIVALPARLDDLRLRAQVLATQIAAAEAEPVAARLAEAQQRHQRAILAYDGVKEQNPEQPKLRAPEYDAMAQSYQGVLPLAEQASAAAAELHDLIGRIDTALAQTPAALSRRQEALDTARQAVAGVAAQGFKTAEQAALLEQAAAKLAAAAEAVQERRFLRADQLLAEAGAQIEAGVAQAQALPQTFQQLQADLAQLDQRIERTTALLAGAQRSFAEISSVFTRACWEDAAQYGPQAERAIAAGHQLLTTARAAATMERQAWTAARAQLTAANEQLGQAEQLIAAIDALKARLEAARASAPGIIEQTRRLRGSVEAELRTIRDDVPDAVWQQLRAAAVDLEAAEDALQQPQPNYLAVIAQAERAQQTLTAALVDGRAAHSDAEQARAAIAAARQEIEQAERYMRRHRRHSGRASHDLVDAHDWLKQAAAATIVTQQLEYAQHAQREAAEAYREAQHDVAAAEAAERAAASHHSSSYGSDSGGGGGSWGSSGGGGGSWGDSGGGGGSWGDSGGGGGSWGDSGGSSSSGDGGSSSGW